MTIREMHSDKIVSGLLDSDGRGRTYRLLCSRLSSVQLADIRNSQHDRIEGSRIETASWIPGADWRGTPYEAIYEHGVLRNPDLAALMFGLIVWEAFERHDNDWYTERFSIGGEEDRFASTSRPVAKTSRPGIGHLNRSFRAWTSEIRSFRT